jgi:hypothetical protein
LRERIEVRVKEFALNQWNWRARALTLAFSLNGRGDKKGNKKCRLPK